jgi:hypothetical protein
VPVLYIWWIESSHDNICIYGRYCIYHWLSLSQSEYNTALIYIYITMIRLSQSDIQYRPYLHILPMRRLSQSDIQYRPYLHMLPWEDSVDQIYNSSLGNICRYNRYCISDRLSLLMVIYVDRVGIIYLIDWVFSWVIYVDRVEDSVDQIYNTDPIYICYEERTQSIRYTIPTLSAYATMRRLSQSDIQYRPYLHMLLREESVKQIYNTDPLSLLIVIYVDMVGIAYLIDWIFSCHICR